MYVFLFFKIFFFSLTSDATHYVTCDQEPITWSLQTNCTLESTLSHIFLFFELRHVGGSLISCKNMLMFAYHPKKNGKSLHAFHHY